LSNVDEELACLVERCNSDDQEAWQEFYARYHRMVLKAVRKSCPRDFSEVEDIVQEVFYNLFVALRSYDPARPIVPFIWAIAKRVTISYLRKNYFPRQLKGPWHDGVPAGPFPCANPEDIVIRKEERVLLRRALDTLPAYGRKLLELRYNDGLSYAEMAARLGVKEVTLRTQVSRYRSLLGRNYERLRAALRRTDDD